MDEAKFEAEEKAFAQNLQKKLAEAKVIELKDLIADEMVKLTNHTDHVISIISAAVAQKGRMADGMIMSPDDFVRVRDSMLVEFIGALIGIHQQADKMLQERLQKMPQPRTLEVITGSAVGFDKGMLEKMFGNELVVHNLDEGEKKKGAPQLVMAHAKINSDVCPQCQKEKLK